MKKLLTFVLIVMMSLTLVACSNKEETVKGEETLIKEAEKTDIPEFMVKICGAKISNKELETYPLYVGISKAKNSEGNERSNEYVGYRLSDVLEAAQITGDLGSAQIICTDGYEFTYEGDIKEEGVLLAITRDGELFKDGPWFAPIPSSTAGDFAQDLSKIELGGISSPLASSKDEKKEENTEEIAFPQDPVSEDKTDKITFADFSFKINGQVVTNADLDGLKIFRNTVVTKNSKDVVSQNKYSGYVLKDVLAKLNINGTKVKTIASDGYEAEYDQEIMNNDLTIIAIEKDKETGKDGTIWLAPCSENTSGKYAKEVVEIIVE